jgi:transmembrane sensor
MDDLLIKYLLGEATAEEVAQVERWLEADAANRKRYEQYKSLWAVGRKMAETEMKRSAPGRPEFWKERRPGQRRNERRAAGRLRLAAVMTGILLLAAGGYLLLMPRQQVATPGQVGGTTRQGGAGAGEVPRTLRLAGARPRTDTLPDGTVVTLNRGGSVEFAGTTQQGMRVSLRGEGFFSVKHDPSRLVVVQVGDVAVTVLGTSFNLSEAGNDSIELIVETGAVRVERRGSAGDSMVVGAGEQLDIGRGGWKTHPKRDNLYGYYLGRPLVCDNTPLRQLVDVLNKEIETPVVLARRDIGDLPLTTVFRGKAPDQILEIVALTFQLSIVREGEKIILQ